jgi:hypothetical protein
MNQQVREALERRLREVEARVSGVAGASHDSSRDPEEDLRALLVKELPAAVVGDLDWHVVMARVARLAEEATTDDLRYVDAWNRVYEEIVGAGVVADASSFLAAYADVLRRVIA